LVDFKALLPAAWALCALAWSPVARADVSSWIFVGAGPSAIEMQDQGYEWQPSLQIETGLGSPPLGSVIFGGIGRLHTHFGSGTDLALLFRTASGGFVRGDWGAALDLGGYQRWWGRESTGGLASVVLGAPWGITASLTGGYGSNDARSVSLVLGLDFARLTVYRQSGQSYWLNTFGPWDRE